MTLLAGHRGWRSLCRQKSGDLIGLIECCREEHRLVQDFQDCDDRGSFDICQLPSTRRPAHPSEHGFSHFTLLARVSPFFACYMRGIRPAWFTHNLQTRSPRMPIGCGDVNPPQESLYAQVRKTTRSAVPRVNHSSFTSFRLGGRLFFWCFTSVACLVKRVRVKNH
jgi:hypothetical protein